MSRDIKYSNALWTGACCFCVDMKRPSYYQTFYVPAWRRKKERENATKHRLGKVRFYI